MKRSHAIGLAAGFALFPRVARAEDTLNPELRASLTQLVAEASESAQTVGFTVAVSHGGNIIYEAARGKRNLDPDEPATVDTWYCIGSLTKQFTAALIMQLVEAHRLALDDYLASVLPDFPHASAVHFRQLLSHTSGLPEYDHEAHVGGIFDKADVKPQELVAVIEGKGLDFTPGSRWEYSNSNYLALGLTLEKLYGKPYADVVRERIVRPLGIDVNPGPPASGIVARGYSGGKDPTPTTFPDTSWAYAAGELYATVRGLIAWDRALFGGRVVNAKSLALMTTPIILPDGHSTDYGFGLLSVTVQGRRMISHNGGVPGGFAAQNFVFPDDGIAIATLANTFDFNEALSATKIADVFFPGIDAAVVEYEKNRVAEIDDPAIRARARDWLEKLRTGQIDRLQLTTEMSDALTDQTLKSVQGFLAALGPVTDFKLSGYAFASGDRIYVYTATTTKGQVSFQFVLDAHDKIAGLFLKP